MVPTGCNWAVWFVQQMFEHLLLDEAGETTLSPGVGLLYIDNFAALALSQVEADDSLTRMLGRLETTCLVARAESSSDTLLGFELADSGRRSGVLAYHAGPSGAGLWQMWSHWYSDQPRPRTCNVSVRITTRTLQHVQYVHQFVTHFEGRAGLVWGLCGGNFALPGRCSFFEKVNS